MDTLKAVPALQPNAPHGVQAGELNYWAIGEIGGKPSQ